MGAPDQTSLFCSDLRSITVNPQSSIKHPGCLLEDGVKKMRFVKVSDFFISRECKIGIENLNMEVRVRNSNKKTRYF